MFKFDNLGGTWRHFRRRRETACVLQVYFFIINIVGFLTVLSEIYQCLFVLDILYNKIKGLIFHVDDNLPNC